MADGDTDLLGEPADSWQHGLAAAPPGRRPVVKHSLALAGYGSRVAAFALDVIGTGFGIWLLAFLGAVMGSVALGVALGIVYALWYHVWRVARAGGTWGMTVMGLRVADRATGRHPIDLGRAVVRALVAGVLGLACIGGIVDLLWPLWDPRNQTLHDKAASTVVLMRR